uniref:Uncharacterized protein n=1 Tax=Pararge aegeria TaxID=116150 RepID=S4P263_9NEOP
MTQAAFVHICTMYVTFAIKEKIYRGQSMSCRNSFAHYSQALVLCVRRHDIGRLLKIYSSMARIIPSLNSTNDANFDATIIANQNAPCLRAVNLKPLLVVA